MSEEELNLIIYTKEKIEEHVSFRNGETKLGQDIKSLPKGSQKNLRQALSTARKSGVRYAILGIPEDIGPRANLGREGADEAWLAFLQSFVNVQSNQFIQAETILLLGEVALADLMEQSRDKDAVETVNASGASAPAKTKGASQETEVDLLRKLCAKIDERVYPIIEHIVASGIEPIVIGGGNNNSFPIIKGVSRALTTEAKPQPIACVNMDAHADFRLMEGRHSGNPFTYAHDQGLLKAYFVLALFENYNSREMLQRLTDAGFRSCTYEAFTVRGETKFLKAVEDAVRYLRISGLPIGLELDVDTIANMPASAKTPYGISLEQSFEYIHAVASSLHTRYLHMSEGAPKWADDGHRTLGRSLAMQVITYVKARQLFYKLKNHSVPLPVS